MNRNILKLYNIAKKDTRLIVGLMSGTSLDGLDLALCKVKGSGVDIQLELLAFETVEYSASFRDNIRSVFSKAEVDMKKLCIMNAEIGIEHAHLVNNLLNRWSIDPSDVDLIASHGQTVFHAPQGLSAGKEHPNSTLQIGDGDHISVHTGIITISDFRQKHVAAGGEGAPLVIYGDYLLFNHPVESRVMLNIGGISNFTFLPAGGETAGIFATDVGPGNTLMNQYMQAHFSRSYDKDGELALAGEVNNNLLNTLLDHPFFEQHLPKSTGPELFNLSFLALAQKKSGTEDISASDIMATLCQFTAVVIADNVLSLAADYPNLTVYISGGGYNNPLLMRQLQAALGDVPLANTSVLGMNPDAKEAAIFSVLANETIAGTPLSFPKLSGAPAVCFGKISFPD